MAAEVRVLVDAYDLVKEVLPAIARFPRAHRFTLGTRIETRLFDLLELLEKARFGLGRAEALDAANVTLQVVAALLRLAADLQIMSLGLYGVLGARLTSVGRQIGGWRKYAGKGGGGSGGV